MKIVTTNDAIVAIAEKVNKTRRAEALSSLISGAGLWEEFARYKMENTFTKGNKSKTMRKIAALPVEVDLFFSKVYGEDYYKDKSFFKNHYPEWLVIDAQKL